MKTRHASFATTLFAALAVASGSVAAEAYEVRLQKDIALASIVAEQRAAMHDQAVCFLREQAESYATAMPVATSSDAIATAEETAPAPGVRAEAAATSRRSNKFALPYFSFGKMTQSRKDP